MHRGGRKGLRRCGEGKGQGMRGCVIIGLMVVLQVFEYKKTEVVDNSFHVIRKVMCTLAV